MEPELKDCYDSDDEFTVFIDELLDEAIEILDTDEDE
jgi:hypothetical protein